MIETLSHEEFVWLAVTLWVIWWARRKAIHEAIFQSPSATHQFICKSIVEVDVTPKKATQAQVTPRAAHTRPKAPPLGYAKIHVDAGIARSTRRGSVAVVSRDESGKFLESSSLVVHGVLDVACLEAVACREALSLAEDLQAKGE